MKDYRTDTEIKTYDEYVVACLELLPHEYRYRVMNAPTIRDYTYDLKVQRIKEYEDAHLAKHKGLLLSYSPTAYVGFLSARQLEMH